MKYKIYGIFLPVLILFTVSSFGQHHRHRFGQRHFMSDMEIGGGALPTGFNDLFAGSGECLMCHNSQVNQQGASISIVADWRSTMMANSAKDPFWQAKVSHEGLVNPGHKAILEDVCTRCHAPVGNHNAHHNGQSHYSADEMRTDPLALDGVQCTVCHQIKESSLGSFSGQVEIGTEKKIWGPFVNPFTTPMINNIGYTPEYSNHINNAKVCGACHTLITSTVDLNGNLTGGEFVEQSIYQEWENSVFPAEGTTCQTCHVPRIDDPVKISSMPPWLDPRSPFGMHHLAGANVFMSRLLRDFGGLFGITATQVQFDSTIARSTRMLQNHTLDIQLAEESRTTDTLFVSLLLENKAGHKFPAGYPSRRAFVELIALDENGDTIFHSGKTDQNFNLIAEDADFESHHLMINSEDQVQIYEMVMGNVNGEVTTVLERAAMHLKDNRIPPAGFSSSHFTWDTVPIVGQAANDEDFNHSQGLEGSGSDKLFFHIPTEGYAGVVSVTTRIFYQTVNDKWLEHMLGYASAEIDLFKSTYEIADKSPVLVGSAEITSISVGFDQRTADAIRIFPNPVTDVIHIGIEDANISRVVAFTANGNIFGEFQVNNVDGEFTISASDYRGILFIRIEGRDKTAVTKKVIVH